MAQWEVIGLSSKQNTVDYSSLVNSVDGVLIRLGYRNKSAELVEDTMFRTHYHELETKTKIGYYWFSQAVTEEEAYEEAMFCHRLVTDHQINLPVYFVSDWYNSSHTGRADSLDKDTRTTLAIVWINNMKMYNHRTGVIASDTWFKTNLTLSYITDTESSIVVSKFDICKPFYVEDYDAWYYTADGEISSVEGYVDLIHYYNNIGYWTDEKIDISNMEMTLYPDTNVYNGEHICPEPIIEGLVKDVDYIVEYENNINAGVAVCSCSGIGNYCGLINKEFVIDPLSLNNFELKLEKSSYEYTINPIIPDYYIEGLVSARDYVIRCENNLLPGEATLYATGINNYIDEISINFIIYTNPDISTKIITITPPEIIYNGNPLTPDVSIKGLKEGRDYTKEYFDNIDAGTATVKITGVGIYQGTVSIPFTIIPLNISTRTITIEENNYIYDGTPKTPAVSVMGLHEGIDYTLEYENNINAGNNARAIIYGKGNFGGTSGKAFRINPATLVGKELTVDPEEMEYTGQELKPTPHIDGLVFGEDYEIAYSNNIFIGHALAIATGINNYGESINTYFTITQQPINGKTLILDPAYMTYTGDYLFPTPIIDGLTLDEDYIVEYHDNLNMGTATVIAYGIGNYKGSTVSHFTIVEKSIADYPLIVEQDYFVYDGIAKFPECHIEGLEEDVDYTIQYTNNLNAGIATITVTGINNYGGISYYYFTIDRRHIEGEYTLTLSQYTYEYDGSYKYPAADIIGLIINRDYEVIYSDNLEVGVASCIATGIGNYIGTLTTYYSITPTDISQFNYYVNPTVYDYDGTYKEPVMTVAGLLQGRDYTVSYSDNLNSGYGFATATGIGNYKGEVTKPFTIKPVTIETHYITEIPVQYYNDVPIEPDVYINGLVRDTDYTVEYINNEYPGIATVIASGINNYFGSISTTFEIRERIDINEVGFFIRTIWPYDFGNPIEPDIETSASIVKNVDYVMSYVNNIEVGIASTTVTGIVAYKGSRTLPFSVIERNIRNDGVIDCGSPDERGYYNLDNRRVYVIDKRDLVKDEEYTEVLNTYVNPISGKIYCDITVTGINNFIGTISATFQIGSTVDDINYHEFTIEPSEYVYNRIDYKPIPSCETLVYEDDYIITGYSDNINAGTGYVHLAGVGEHYGEVDVPFTILPKPIESFKIAIGPITQESYDHNTARVIDVEGEYFELINGLDVDLSFNDYILVELKISDITAVGKGNYTGTLKERFYLNDRFLNIADTDVHPEFDSYVYTGGPINPSMISENRIEGIDFVPVYDSDFNAGEHTVTVHGIGNYNNSIKLCPYTITPKSLTTCIISCGEPDDEQYYNKDNYAITTSYGAELIENVDYTLITETVVDHFIGSKITIFTATGIGNYKDTVVRSWGTAPIDDEDVPENPKTIDDIEPRMPIELFGAPVYARYSSRLYDNILTGIYIIYDGNIINDRLLVVQSHEAFDNPCMITGWVDVNEVLSKESPYEIKDKVIVNGKIYKKPDGTGLVINKNNETMYVTSIITDTPIPQYRYGLSSESYTSIQGYGDAAVLKHYTEEAAEEIEEE